MDMKLWQKQKIQKDGKIIILACHDKEELFFLSDEIIEIENGAIKRQYLVSDSKEDRKGSNISE